MRSYFICVQFVGEEKGVKVSCFNGLFIQGPKIKGPEDLDSLTDIVWEKSKKKVQEFNPRFKLLSTQIINFVKL